MTKPGNVLPFRRSTGETFDPQEAANTSTMPPIKAKTLTTNGVKNKFLIFLKGSVRYSVFLLLLWISFPIRLVLTVLSVTCLIALPIIILGVYDDPRKPMMIIAVLTTGLGSFALSWFYGVALVKFGPRTWPVN